MFQLLTSLLHLSLCWFKTQRVMTLANLKLVISLSMKLMMIMELFSLIPHIEGRNWHPVWIGSTF